MKRRRTMRDREVDWHVCSVLQGPHRWAFFETYAGSECDFVTFFCQGCLALTEHNRDALPVAFSPDQLADIADAVERVPG